MVLTYIHTRLYVSFMGSLLTGNGFGCAPQPVSRLRRGAARWSKRLPDTEHTARPWRIHQIEPDFEVEDVWAFRTQGTGPDDFPLMLTAQRAAGGMNENPPVVRFLFAVRWQLVACSVGTSK